MGAETMTRQRRTARDGRRTFGAVVLLVGLVGLAAWGVLALFAATNGSVASDTLAGRIAAEGVEDPVNEPTVVTARDASGTVVFEGTRRELDAVLEEGRSAHQDDLRQRWLYPAAGVAAVGGVVLLVGRRAGRSRDTMP